MRRIVIVEDHPLMAGALEANLERADGFTVVGTVTSGHQAEPLVARTLPDLVLLDLNLPGSDGFSILSAVRAEARLESMPVIVISTSSRDEDIAHSYRLGCNAYVVKPESASTFIQVIHALSHYWLGVDPTDPS
jgi:DNA-binding NarL/FixJ family response regulator